MKYHLLRKKYKRKFYARHEVNKIYILLSNHGKFYYDLWVNIFLFCGRIDSTNIIAPDYYPPSIYTTIRIYATWRMKLMTMVVKYRLKSGNILEQGSIKNHCKIRSNHLRLPWPTQMWVLVFSTCHPSWPNNADNFLPLQGIKVESNVENHSPKPQVTAVKVKNKLKQKALQIEVMTARRRKLWAVMVKKEICKVSYPTYQIVVTWIGENEEFPRLRFKGIVWIGVKKYK